MSLSNSHGNCVNNLINTRLCLRSFLSDKSGILSHLDFKIFVLFLSTLYLSLIRPSITGFKQFLKLMCLSIQMFFIIFSNFVLSFNLILVSLFNSLFYLLFLVSMLLTLLFYFLFCLV